MGAIKTMNKMEEIQRLREYYGQVKECLCGKWAVPGTDTFYEDFNGETLEMYNFPVFKCLECDEITYSPADYLKHMENAIKHFERTNEKFYNCHETK